MQFESSWYRALETPWLLLEAWRPRYIFFSAMGGSALTLDILQDYVQLEDPIRPILDYHLPNYANSQDLVICASYSGNTEEVLSIFSEALKKEIPILCIGHGGQLKDLAKKFDFPHINIPNCVQPRCALGYFLASLLAILYRLERCEDHSHILSRLAAFLKDHQSEFEEEGKKLASFLINRVPIIHGPSSLAGTCRNWKIKFNENCKVPSFYNVFPELNHNEMVGWTQNIIPASMILLKSPLMDSRMQQRMNVFENILGEKIPIYPLKIKGQHPLEVIFASLQIADFASYYLAQTYQVDPAAVPIVENFKKQLQAYTNFSLDFPEAPAKSKNSMGKGFNKKVS
ncbi:MAG: bifunctional phosphoglucose/phosphomannose isomerase [Deltaproteobacteria bacterium]|nr:bifunctional phosphoglucose/phosphomannose isomerase [Deltaproteobacteria bacterium]